MLRGVALALSAVLILSGCNRGGPDEPASSEQARASEGENSPALNRGLQSPVYTGPTEAAPVVPDPVEEEDTTPPEMPAEEPSQRAEPEPSEEAPAPPPSDPSSPPPDEDDDDDDEDEDDKDLIPIDPP